MLVKIYRKFNALSFEGKVFTAIIALGLIARLFALIVMPDPMLNDSLYHLGITKYAIENRALPLGQGGISALEVPLYYFVTALPFIFLPIPFTLATARVFPFLFSALQLFLAFILLKRIFPRNWLPGFAFVAMQPLLIVFGSLNYVETFASCFVLLCFYIYWRFAETGKTIYLVSMPFAIAAAALSKLSATVLVPAFFLAFLFELVKGKQKQAGQRTVAKGEQKLARQKIIATALLFSIAAILLSSAWFIAMFFRGNFSVSQYDANTLLSGHVITYASLNSVITLPAKFNEALWFFLTEALDSHSFVVPANIAFLLFSIATGPVLIFLFYGLVQGLLRKEKQSILLLLCFALMCVLLAARGTKFIQSRFMVPMLPLFGIAAASAFMHLKNANWRKAIIFFFCLTAIYSIAFSALYAMYFRQQFDQVSPALEFARQLPSGSVIAVHPNQTRQVEFISEKKAFGYQTSFDLMDAAQLHTELKSHGITHIAPTCYKNPWNMQAIEEMAASGKLQQIYGDECSKLFEVR